MSDLSKINRNNVSGSVETVETEQLNIPLPVTRLLGHFYPLMSTLNMQVELFVISETAQPKLKIKRSLMKNISGWRKHFS